MTTRSRIALTTLGASATFAACITIDAALRSHGSWWITVFLFPASYFLLISILVHIGEINGLFEYAWIFHAAQFVVYGWIFARFWTLDRPKKGAIIVLTIHLLMIIIYVGRALLHEHTRI